MKRTKALVGAALVACAVASAACEGRAPRAGSGSTPAETSSSKSSASDGPIVAEIDLSRGVPEARATSLLGTPSRRSHTDLVRALRAISGDDRRASSTRGLFVRLGTASTGLARAQEIGALLGEIRKTKPVVCHADEYDNATMLLASRGCSKIWVSPAGGVEAVGIAAQMFYANRLLTRLNVGVDFLQIGKYKGAEEPFTRDGPSPEARSSLESALRGMRAGWLSDIVAGRGKLQVGDAVEDGPFSPPDAMAKGLVDAIGDVDDAREDVKKTTGAERLASRFGGGEGARGSSGGLASVVRALAGSGRIGTPHVAVVPASGSIAMSGSGSILGGGDGITERDLGPILAKLTKDTATKAVVLRIDSPGGSALASDLLWKKLMKLRAAKPLVVSVGDMAASGGYYMACAGTKIVAEPTSILGSIGVVAGKFAVGPALEPFGVHVETVPAAPDPRKGARASYMSAVTPWDDDTRERVRTSMISVYDLFLQRVAEGRGTTVDKIAPSAEGRVYGGEEAKERGMIDSIGGLSDAIDLAISLAGLPKDAPIDVIAEESGLLDFLDEGPMSAESGDALANGAKRAAREAFIPPALRDAIPGGSAFLGALSPLVTGVGAGGERVIAAMPYGITVR